MSTVVTNETGAYNFPSLQTGRYKATAEPRFQTQTYNGVILGVSQQVRLNFTQVGTQARYEYKVRDLPLASRNILDLVATASGTQGNNFAGGRLTQLNTTRRHSGHDGRYDTGAATTTYVSPDLVDEVSHPSRLRTPRWDADEPNSNVHSVGHNEFQEAFFTSTKKLNANS